MLNSAECYYPHLSRLILTHFNSIPFHSVYSILTHFIPFHSVLAHSILIHSIQFCSIISHFILSISTVLYPPLLSSPALPLLRAERPLRADTLTREQLRSLLSESLLEVLLPVASLSLTMLS